MILSWKLETLFLWHLKSKQNSEIIFDEDLFLYFLTFDNNMTDRIKVDLINLMQDFINFFHNLMLYAWIYSIQYKFIHLKWIYVLEKQNILEFNLQIIIRCALYIFAKLTTRLRDFGENVAFFQKSKQNKKTTIYLKIKI